MTRTWLDVSVPLRDGMVRWPGDPPVRIERAPDAAPGGAPSVPTLSMGTHTGTHMDAPLHFVPGAAGLDALPFEAVIGPARVIEIADAESIKPAPLRRCRIRRGERILFKTRNSARCWRTSAFVEDYVFIAADAARFLADRGVRAVGVDYLSVDGFRNEGEAAHRALLGAGIWVIEGLDLSAAAPGRYDMICLPLRIASADGAPARVVLRRSARAGRFARGGG